MISPPSGRYIKVDSRFSGKKNERRGGDVYLYNSYLAFFGPQIFAGWHQSFGYNESRGRRKIRWNSSRVISTKIIGLSRVADEINPRFEINFRWLRDRKFSIAYEIVTAIIIIIIIVIFVKWNERKKYSHLRPCSSKYTVLIGLRVHERSQLFETRIFSKATGGGKKNSRTNRVSSLAGHRYKWVETVLRNSEIVDTRVCICKLWLIYTPSPFFVTREFATRMFHARRCVIINFQCSVHICHVKPIF